MAYTRILIDTNSYLRLGKSITPLLGQPFGKAKYSLYLHPEEQREIDRINRTKPKFFWVEQEEYRRERKKIITTSKKEKINIDNTYEHVWNYQKDNLLGLSSVDIYCISTAIELKLKLVTDDLNMRKAAEVFGVETMKTLELMELMVAENFITISKVKETVSYWVYITDTPAEFVKDYKRIFNDSPPIN